MTRRRKPDEKGRHRQDATPTPYLRVVAGGNTDLLSHGYTRLFNGITDALEALRYGNCDAAIALLQKAQKEAEESFIK